jgi:hypothetical protein
MLLPVRDVGGRGESLRNPDGVAYDTPGIMKITKDYYKNMFSWESRGAAALGELFWDAEDLVTPEENIGLIAPFSKQEVKEAVFGSYAGGAPGQMVYLFYSTRNFGI